MIENLTRLGVDLGGPTLVAYAVVALVAGLLGMAVGSLLELLRTRRLGRLATQAVLDAPEPPFVASEPAFAWGGPALASEPGLDDWYTGGGLVVEAPRRARTQLAF